MKTLFLIGLCALASSVFLHVRRFPDLFHQAVVVKYDATLSQPKLPSTSETSAPTGFPVRNQDENEDEEHDLLKLSEDPELCERHKSLVKAAVRSFEFPPWVLDKLSCKKLQRSIADWYHPAASAPFQLFRLTKAVEALEEGKRVRMAVLGGSVSSGHSDYFPVGGITNAWPVWLERMMRTVWKKVQVDNLSSGGSSSMTHALNFDKYASEGYDVFLLELAVNDQCQWAAMKRQSKKVHERSNTLFELILPLKNHPAVACVELFRSSFRSSRDANRHCKGHVQDLGNEVYFCEQWWYPQDWRKQSRLAHHVPMVSYRDAVFPNVNHPPADLNETWSGKSHPGPFVHFWIAEAVFFAFLNIKQHTTTDFEPKERSDLCTKKATSFAALEGASKFVPKSRGCGWEFREDVAGKPGWIIQGPEGLTKCDFSLNASREISFMLNVKDVGLVVGTFLESYDERMGKAEAWLVQVPESKIVLNSRIKEHFSVPQHFRMTVPEKFRNRLLELKFRILLDNSNKQQKFKLLTLSSC